MSIWQTQSWQEMLVHSGQTSEYFMIERNISTGEISDDTELSVEDCIFVEKRKVSLGEYGLFVIGLEGELDGSLTESLVALCQEEKCLFIQIETLDYSLCPSDIYPSVSLSGAKLNSPGSLDEGDLMTYPLSRGIKGEFTFGHYKKFIPPHTVVIDLTQTEEEILAAMKQKGRYNIRLAEKKGVVVEQVEKNSHNAKIYYDLMNLTTTRNNFAGNTQKYYEEFLENIEDSQLFFAYYEETVIAAGIFVYEGDTAIYYYGASNNDYRKFMAPHLLQWKAIEHAKKRGCKIYDFLGVAGPDEENSSLAGVTKFKMQLSPDRRKVSESYIFVNKKIKYFIIQALKKIRK